VLSWSPLALEACFTTEVPEYAENEPKLICLLEAESHLGKQHFCGQKGSDASREHATWSEEERKSRPPWDGGDDFCNAVEIVYMLVCTLE
jgi:hypothetical protein